MTTPELKRDVLIYAKKRAKGFYKFSKRSNVRVAR